MRDIEVLITNGANESKDTDIAIRPISHFSHFPIHAPRGTTISCKGWQQEAALRMLMNNLDPDVAERPEELIVYGGSGKAARNWECYHTLVETLERLGNKQTLLV